MALHPCPRCDRHVHHNESRCPFCGESLPAMSTESVHIPRMSRAAMLLTAAAVSVGALQGCERTTPNPAPISTPPNPQPNLNDPNAVAQVYGAPPIEVRDSGVAQQEPQQPAQADAAAVDPSQLGATIYGGPPVGEQNNRPSHNMPMTTRYGAPAWVEDDA